MISACSFEAWNSQVVDMSFPVSLITIGPANLDAMRSLLNLCALVLAKMSQSHQAGQPAWKSATLYILATNL